MKSICITGATQSDLQIVGNLLEQAGMNSPRPTRREDSMDMAGWHEQVMAIATKESGDIQLVSNPGRLWEQVASDIFVANVKSKLWGWSDTRSIWLLDFWLNFEPRLNFILVSVSPQQMLARAIATETGPVSVEAVMNAWRVHHQELLRFHHRNPQRSLLADARECAAHPRAFVERCVSQWKLPLEAPTGATSSPIEHDGLALYLAHQLCRDYPETVGLQHELAATITHFGEAGQVAGATGPESGQIIAEYRALRDRSAELQQVQAARDELAALKARFDDTAAAHASQLQNLEASLKKSSQENELLLLQMHQIQEELETSFLKDQSRQEQIDALIQANASLNGEKDALAGEKSALVARRDALERQVLTLEQARDELGKLAAERQTRLDLLAGNRAPVEDEVQSETLKAIQTKYEETVQENELLLLQLHQVQEELEHYFLQHQGVQKQLKAAEARWQRMLQRNPDYCDCESIQVLAAEAGEGAATTWRLKEVNAAGRSLSELEFKTTIESGIAGFVLSRQPGTTGPLIRWPASAAHQNELSLIPAGPGASVAQRIETLLDLATGDWDLLQTLTRLLANTLESPAMLKAPASLQPEALRNGLGKLAEIFAGFPAALRYDRVSLKREQVNPDYEHLWLRLENVAFGGNRWPEFDFRLSCANVRPGDFGSHPKLEFPEESGQVPFDAWFIESYDDFGAKLELRFALPEAMDLGVWQRVSENDRAFLRALIERLPAILVALKGADVQIRRSWDDWVRMACEIQRVVTLRTEPPPGRAPAVPAQAAAGEVSRLPPALPTQSENPASPLKIPGKAADKPASKIKAAGAARAPNTRKAR